MAGLGIFCEADFFSSFFEGCTTGRGQPIPRTFLFIPLSLELLLVNFVHGAYSECCVYTGSGR